MHKKIEENLAQTHPEECKILDYSWYPHMRSAIATTLLQEESDRKEFAFARSYLLSRSASQKMETTRKVHKTPTQTHAFIKEEFETSLQDSHQMQAIQTAFNQIAANKKKKRRNQQKEATQSQLKKVKDKPKKGEKSDDLPAIKR